MLATLRRYRSAPPGLAPHTGPLNVFVIRYDERLTALWQCRAVRPRASLPVSLSRVRIYPRRGATRPVLLHQLVVFRKHPISERW